MGSRKADLLPPFQWYGGKRNRAHEINARIGDVDTYSEPFAGSLACLLQRRPAKFEIVCDLDGALCNFWRSVKKDPAAVAEHAFWPPIHQDLVARHRYLVAWAGEHSARLMADPEYCDLRAAGWWLWGVRRFIGSLWCGNKKVPLSRPHIGYQVSRAVPTGELLASIAERLEQVFVLNQSWQAAVTPAGLASGRGAKTFGILLDPPYLTGQRGDLYSSDMRENADTAAEESYRWAVEHGDEYRIAYCCHDGDFALPDEWTMTRGGFQGVRRADRKRHDIIMYSPPCVGQPCFPVHQSNAAGSHPSPTLGA